MDCLVIFGIAKHLPLKCKHILACVVVTMEKKKSGETKRVGIHMILIPFDDIATLGFEWNASEIATKIQSFVYVM